ncbi:MAG: hypothetical protein ACOC6C_06970 [Verrucomicrobiota bacterium]
MMLDPLSAAVCSPAEIRQMAEELFKAESRYIPAWCRAKAGTKKKSRTRPGKKASGKNAESEVSGMAARNVE